MDNVIEQLCKQLKIGGIARNWKDVEFKTKEQYIYDLLTIEVREREVNKINRKVKSAGFKGYKNIRQLCVDKQYFSA